MRKRSKFNLGNFHNCTFKMGFCYPTALLEVLPGDSIQMSQSAFFRLAPMVAPVMHPVHMFTHFFFIPTRIIADVIGFDFESFITGGPDGNDAQTLPQVILTAANSPSGYLADAFGIPVQMLKGSNQFSVNALPFIAYYMIWNEYYRDQDLDSEVDFTRVGGSNPYERYGLKSPCWSKDYFTTSRPWPQKGPAVTIPIQGTDGQEAFKVLPDGIMKYSLGSEVSNAVIDSANSVTGYLANDNGIGYHSQGTTGSAGDHAPTPINGGSIDWLNPDTTYSNSRPFLASRALTYESGLKLNVGASGDLGISVQDLREAMAIQRFEEARSLYGSRYEDYLRYLGVRPQDSRLQMPEYLGGYTAPVQFSEVLQTSAGEYGGVGDMAGHGISAARSRRIRRFIPEHGYIMAITCVRPIPVYAQGLERLWSKKTKFDFWEKKLEHVGQQEVLNSEVYADGTVDDSKTFGYQNRYDEYRRGVNIITGEFRTNQDFWTMARIFESRPALNSTFVSCTPTDRIFQVGSSNSDQLYAMFKNNIIARRLVSKNGNPI